MRFRQMACSNFFYYSLAVEIKLEAAIAHLLSLWCAHRKSALCNASTTEQLQYLFVTSCIFKYLESSDKKSLLGEFTFQSIPPYYLPS